MPVSNPIRDPRLARALDDALEGGDVDRFVDLAERASNLPGKPNLALAQALGEVLAATDPGRALAAELARFGLTDKREVSIFHAYVGLGAIGLSAIKRPSRKALSAIEDAAGDGRHEAREAAAFGLRLFAERAQDGGLEALDGFFDGYLHASVALGVLGQRSVLDRVRDGAALVARIDQAFQLADASPRAAERSQGLRTLRGALPLVIGTAAGRFSHELLTWLEGALDTTEHPLSRKVLDESLAALRKAHLGDAEVDRLRERLAGSAPPPRDPSRIVHGTRKRSRGRK